jgi:hypothetical protein
MGGRTMGLSSGSWKRPANYKKGGKVMNYCAGGKVISTYNGR